MTATIDNAVADLQAANAELRRQLDEYRVERDEAFAQQTATAEVLQVINSSPGDLAPVFNAMLEKAMELCAAAFGVLWTYDGEDIRAVAHRGVPPAFAEFIAKGSHRADTDLLTLRLLEGAGHVAIADIPAGEAYRAGYPFPRALVDLGGGRSLLSVPLRKDDVLFGFIIMYWREVQSFEEKQIVLLQNFAAQAVIAMENARLITETREALEQQTATAEVLGVINSSPGDLTPVFDAILEKAQSLCGAAFGLLFTYDGVQINAAALHNIPEGFAEFLTRGAVTPAPQTTLYRAIHDRKPIQIVDVMAEDHYREGDPFAVNAVKFAGV